ncbi:kanosamine-6-phosphate phosphatase [Micromonospora phaseoli]|uniref:Kanosamine-6-phosphate phosphatase n=1 Tax=Micromonospora phaseoli TaxID=1144548 RepID=A0A1H7DRC0_9ACTN|nr:HAD-IIB family hydrolase [Micromonospora phaseoli]PZV89960.1 kanosamine-6-phosphate phosphatase [Micromonospora phaseoli]GIJ78826.1 kanosamine-6-phosphate phosphatase [Micromonospora phaseoli]SEK04303.1 kanosamine-6-phosphate phosphatase [Micromonospora phaseoli]
MPPSAPTGELLCHLVRPDTVRRVAFCDFDETYLAHQPTAAQRRSLRELEAYLVRSAGQGLLFGWVTGSSLVSVTAKARRHELAVMPHFVAAALGTELVFFADGVPVPDPVWQQRIAASGFSADRVDLAVEALAARGIRLTPQPTSVEKEYVASYYHQARGTSADRAALVGIRSEARRHGLGVNISRCNPLAGDPEDAYDVDLLPDCCGKRNVVRHVCQRFGVPTSVAYAFGDSGNDLEMLAAVGHGLLVANATAEARSRHERVSPHPYAEAVLHALQQAPRTVTDHTGRRAPRKTSQFDDSSEN